MASVAITSPPLVIMSPRRRLILILAVMSAMIMQILDTTIATVALPHMQTSLGATMDSVNWVLTSYVIASAIAIPVTGWLSDQFGSRQLFLWSVAGFILTSMACGAATSLEQMVVFRFLQGVSAAFIGPLSQAVMLDISPKEEHGQAMAIWGMGVMVGPIMGPILGGWLTESYNWRWVFYVNLPVGIVTLALLWVLLPNQPLRKRRFDLFGFSMLAVGLAALQLMFDRGAHEDWFNSTEIVLELALAMCCIWIFCIHMATTKNPMFERRLFTDRNFPTALIFMIVLGVVMFASMALLPPMLQRLFGYPVIDTGIILALRGVGILISMGIAGRLLGVVDARWMVSVGLIITVYSLWQMSHFSLEMGMEPVLISGLIQGLGMGLVFIPLNTMAFATLPPHLRTDGASLLNLFRSIGASFGISIVSTLLGANVQTLHEEIGGKLTGSSLAPIDPSTLDRFGVAGEAALRMIDGEVNRQALMIAYIDNYWAMMWMTLASLPLVLLLRPPAKGSAPPPMGE
jgi:DHA2 family multidrug resistance protein